METVLMLLVLAGCTTGDWATIYPVDSTVLITDNNNYQTTQGYTPYYNGMGTGSIGTTTQTIESTDYTFDYKPAPQFDPLDLPSDVGEVNSALLQFNIGSECGPGIPDASFDVYAITQAWNPVLATYYDTGTGELDGNNDPFPILLTDPVSATMADLINNDNITTTDTQMIFNLTAPSASILAWATNPTTDVGGLMIAIVNPYEVACSTVISDYVLFVDYTPATTTTTVLTTTTTAAPTTTTTTVASKSSVNLGAVIGGSVAGVVVLGGIIALMYYQHAIAGHRGRRYRLMHNARISEF